MELNLSDEGLQELPEILPSDITLLDCSKNSLTYLPELPNSLRALYCIRNRLTTLPELPSNLIMLNCNRNLITSLPDLNKGLLSFSCDFNLLTSLPKLPENLENLHCTDNQLTTLPKLPNSLIDLDCWNNPFVAPFDAFVNEYEETRDLDLLRRNIDRYYVEVRREIKRKGRNLGGLMATLGRSELQGRMDLGNNNTLRNVKANGTRKTLNKLPLNTLGVIGNYLTGINGSVNQKRNTLKQNLSGGRRKRRKSRKY